MPISRAEYNRHQKRLDNYIVLNSDGVSEQALGEPAGGLIPVSGMPIRLVRT
ncbi:hypothetical protein Slin_0885 [Spirosoma linguale DSM 74]|uniref:Uncharacterized protein n=1 Tax=Spirosoma linguale (strain ATCC 33905 / DSM 74 / LMG 10896 / Claus 1) TaxID=504472 RepID=D2QI51_SPILD|nr:hypothetical protein Slin_0885 [Spirosoma linguale DSM 74]